MSGNPLARRTLAQRIAENGRHYGARLRKRADTWHIRYFAATRYAALRIPAWNDVHVKAIASQQSALSHLLAPDENAIANAERVLAGEYRLFGTIIRVDHGFPDWHLDYLSGHRYPIGPYPTHTIDIDNGSDIICPWELSRFHFVMPLVNAFRATGDRRYMEGYFAVVADWERRNPWLFGVNWMSGLDIAIRALNIAIGLSFFARPEDARCATVRRLLWSHIVYLQQRDLYEPKRVVNNHQLIAAAIQVALLHWFTGPEVEAWKASARAIVSRETMRQFHQDGGNFESAFAYHQFSLEALALMLLVEPTSGKRDRSVDIAGSDYEVRERVHRAIAFSSSYTQAWGEMPQIGDSSDGRVVFDREYFDWRPTDPAYLEDLSAVLFPEDDPFAAGRDHPARLFRDSGVGTFANSRYGLLITALRVCPPAGGHNHFDQTSIVLRVGTHPLLIDSGTCCYTPNVTSRNRFRSGRSHNALLIANKEPASVAVDGVFAVPDFGNNGVRLETSSDSVPVFTAWHDAYARIGICGTVTRLVRCLDDRVEILDRVEGTGDINAELVFNFHPDISALVIGEELSLAVGNRPLACMRVSPDWRPSQEIGACSPSYGSRRECSRVVFSRRLGLPFEVRTTIGIISQSTCTPR